MTVGVAPGTYTMQLGAPLPCPPDEPGWYLTPPFEPGWPYYTGVHPVAQFWDPYATPSKLRGTGLGADGLIDFTVLGMMLGGVATIAILVSLFSVKWNARR